MLSDSDPADLWPPVIFVRPSSLITGSAVWQDNCRNQLLKVSPVMQHTPVVHSDTQLQPTTWPDWPQEVIEQINSRIDLTILKSFDNISNLWDAKESPPCGCHQGLHFYCLTFTLNHLNNCYCWEEQNCFALIICKYQSILKSLFCERTVTEVVWTSHAKY